MLIQKILTHDFIYQKFVKHFLKNGFLKTKYGFIDLSDQHPFIQSLIFWNVYERKEIRSIKKYLNSSLDIIELGSSIGFVSLCIASLLKKNNTKFIAIEANPFLHKNLQRSKEFNDYNIEFINAALSYSKENALFEVDERNLGSKIVENSNKSISVKTITLKEIIEKYDIDNYCLVSDIEGSEVEILFEENDVHAIYKCKQIIIELHDIVYKNVFYNKSELAEIFIKKFNLIQIFTDGNIWVLNKY